MKKNDQPPLSKEERVQITREAVRMAIKDFLEDRKREVDRGLLKIVKKILWLSFWSGLAWVFNLFMHGKYQKVADFLIHAAGSN